MTKKEIYKKIKPFFNDNTVDCTGSKHKFNVLLKGGSVLTNCTNLWIDWFGFYFYCPDVGGTNYELFIKPKNVADIENK